MALPAGRKKSLLKGDKIPPPARESLCPERNPENNCSMRGTFPQKSLFPSRPPRSWRAAALSFSLHLLLLLLLALLLKYTPAGALIAEPARRVSLVLTDQADPDSAERTYLEEPAATPSPEKPAVAPTALPEKPLTLPPETTSPPASSALAAESPLEGLVGPATSMTTGVTGEAPSNELSAAARETIAAEQRELANRPQPGPLATTAIFGSGPIKGRRFAFVLDRSKSMGAGGLDVLSLAQLELFQALAPLAPENQFQIVAYHQQTVTLKGERLLPASEENKSEVREFIQRLVPFGSTDHEAGLYMALELDPDVIILLTDGDTPELNDGQIQDLVRVSKGRATIHCIQFGLSAEEPPGSFMRKLAGRTSGSYRYINVNQLRKSAK